MADHPLCIDVAPDGLKCAADFPHCADPDRCRTSGCYWRKWHDIPADQMRVSGQSDLFVEVEGNG